MADLPAEIARAIRFTDGAPDVSGLPCDKIEAGDAGEYMRRYHIQNAASRGIRFHHILQSDPGTDCHDHPWDFVSVMLDGTYTEHTPSGIVVYTAPCVIMRKAEQLHRLELAAPVWTYVITGRARRRWGYATQHGWVHWTQYATAGPWAPCEPPTSRTW